MKFVITQAMKAAILAGGSEIDIDASTIPGAGDNADPAKVAADAAAAAAAATAAASAAAAAKEGETKPGVTAPTDVVAYLTSQVQAKDTALLDANVKIAQLTTAAAEASACLPDLLKIAQSSVGVMQVALGASDTASALSAKDTIAEHTRVSELFKAKFPTGRMSAVTEDKGTLHAENSVVVDLQSRLAARNK